MQTLGEVAVVVVAVVIPPPKKRRVTMKKMRRERRRRARRKKARRKRRRRRSWVHVAVVVSAISHASKQAGKKVVSTPLTTEVSLCSKEKRKTPDRVMHTPRHTFA
jgi:hypothetical protein